MVTYSKTCFTIWLYVIIAEVHYNLRDFPGAAKITKKNKQTKDRFAWTRKEAHMIMNIGEFVLCPVMS